MENAQQILALLERIAIALEPSGKPAVREGFFEYSKKIFANATRGRGDGWYSLEEGVATTQPPLFRGRVVSISFPKRLYEKPC